MGIRGPCTCPGRHSWHEAIPDSAPALPPCPPAGLRGQWRERVAEPGIRQMGWGGTSSQVGQGEGCRGKGILRKQGTGERSTRQVPSSDVGGLKRRRWLRWGACFRGGRRAVSSPKSGSWQVRGDRQPPGVRGGEPSRTRVSERRSWVSFQVSGKKDRMDAGTLTR